jgi:glycosyltransferase involved in cell wall biosynthesis
MPTPHSFIVVQVGARMNYAVPALLSQAGMLERLYTDIHAGDFLVRLGLSWLPVPIQPRVARRILGRQLPADVANKTRSVQISAIHSFFRGPQPDSQLRQLLLSDGFGNATAIYTLSNRDIEVVRAARNAGLFVVHEQILNPDVGRILREERKAYPGIEPQDSLDQVNDDEQRDFTQWREAHLLLAPSHFVRAGMARMGADPDKIAIVEYGLPEEWLRNRPQPVPGRVLFVGSVGLRKGNHYLAHAKRLLDHRRIPTEVRVVGPATPGLLRHREFQGPHYEGQIPRVQMAEEFRRADVFVLPTLSDSFALVHLEALAWGVPVITTPNCGSVVRDGIDGFVVPIRNAEVIAEKIETILGDRDLRDWMSRNAKQRAREYTWTRYKERLLQAVSAAQDTCVTAK